MTEDQLQQLRTKRTEALDAANTIVALAESEDRGLTDEEQASVDEHVAEATRLKDQLEGVSTVATLRQTLDAEIAYQPPSTQRATETPAPRQSETHRIDVMTPAYEMGDALGALICARTKFGQDREGAVAWAESKFGSGSNQVRALQQAVFTAGGALLEENFVGAELIELLRAQAAVRRAGARQIPLVNGTATIPKITGGATSAWGVEGDNITASEETLGNLVLVEKKLTSLVPFSNDLIKNASLEVTRMIRDDMVASSANTEDLAFLRGDGLAGAPKGIFNWVGTAGQTATAGTTLANVRTDIRTALNSLGNNNVPMRTRAWFMHSRGANYMGWDLVDGNSNFAFPLMQSPTPSINGAPVMIDNNLPITQGGGTETEVYYAEMTECIIADSQALEVEIFANATYVDSGGNLRSGVSRDESVIRLIRKTDFGMRHTTSAHVTTAVTWGA